jgi:hypothetical protein
MAFWGREAADRYSQLLSTYAIALRDLISAQLEGNAEAVNQNVNRLYQDQSERASFISSINPYVNEKAWLKQLETYLQYTIEEANNIMSGNYKKNIELFDRLNELGSQLGDALAQSLYNYVTSGTQEITPPQNRQPCLTDEQVDSIYNIRMFWYEMLTWVRSLCSKYSSWKAKRKYIPVKADSENYVNTLDNSIGIIRHRRSYLS